MKEVDEILKIINSYEQPVVSNQNNFDAILDQEKLEESVNNSFQSLQANEEE